MYILPLPFLLGTLASIASIALLGGGLYIFWLFVTGAYVTTAWLASGAAMLAWSFLGRAIVLAFYPRGTDEPHATGAAAAQTVDGADGSRLHVEFDGPLDAPVIVLTHGWALDSQAWYYTRKALAREFRLIVWDLPGLGRSTQPADRRYSVERLAEDLRGIVALAGGRPVTLVGHSIGGMMMLTLARLHPAFVRERVNGMVIVDSTHRWPLDSVMLGGLLKVLRWPVVEPLLLLTIVLSPLIWLSNVQSYMNGTSHIINRITSLSRGVTRGQLDFGSKYNVKDKPSVIAKGLRAVLRWQEADTPRSLPVPLRVIAGDADRLTKPWAGKEMSAMAPRGEFVSVAPAGHNGILESGEYGVAIGEFVRSLVGNGAHNLKA
jgi:pimeloyl-ACP methyl ester carboxylesterase